MSDTTTTQTPAQLATETAKAPACALGFKVARAEASYVTEVQTMLKGADAVTFDQARSLFALGYIAQRLAPTAKTLTGDAVSAAAAMLRKAGHTSTTKPENERQTAEEAKVAAAGRKAWERLLKAAGLVTQETRGGAREQAAAPAQAPTQSETTQADPNATAATTQAPEGAKYSTPKHGAAYLSTCAGTMTQTARKFPTAFNTAMLAAVEHFAAEVARIQADLAAAE
jgi:hypothetical protein